VRWGEYRRREKIGRWSRLVVLVVLVVLAGCSDGGIATGTGASTPTVTGTAPDGRTAPPTSTEATGSATATVPKAQWNVEVVRVIDGDTFEVRFADGHTEAVRLLGVDTPEVHVAVDPPEYEGIPDTEAGRTWLRDWGHKASEFARLTVGGETVTIAVDPVADRRGSYGRLLVYVYHDGTNFNRQLVEQGYARLYDSTFSKRDAFASAEATAQANHVGLWNFDGPTTTIGDGGTTLAIVTIHADAAGNDNDNLNDEYVVLKNTGSSAIDVSGWTMSDEAGHTFEFPQGFVLDGGDTVTIRTGKGTNTDGTIYWGSNSAIWNNGGDTIVVRDGDGNVVLVREYS
jgi:micrococcal nuclease